MISLICYSVLSIWNNQNNQASILSVYALSLSFCIQIKIFIKIIAQAFNYAIFSSRGYHLKMWLSYIKLWIFSEYTSVHLLQRCCYGDGLFTGGTQKLCACHQACWNLCRYFQLTALISYLGKNITTHYGTTKSTDVPIQISHWVEQLNFQPKLKWKSTYRYKNAL